MGHFHWGKVQSDRSRIFRHASRAGRSSAPTGFAIPALATHRTECRDCKASDAALRRSRAGVPKVCAASERHRPAISTCEGRCRENVLSAWNVVSSSSATGLSPVVHPPSRPTDLQSPLSVRLSRRAGRPAMMRTSSRTGAGGSYRSEIIMPDDRHAMGMV